MCFFVKIKAFFFYIQLNEIKLNSLKCLNKPSHYNPSSLIPLAWRGIRLLEKFNLQFCDLCKARAISWLSEE